MTKSKAGRVRARLLSALFIAALPFTASAACKLVKLGEVPLHFQHVPIIDVSMNGHATQLVVDTGAFSSLLFQSAIDRYDLGRRGGAQKACGVGGCGDTRLVVVKDFALDQYVVHDLRFVAAPTAGDTMIAGLLGQDFLSQMDVEFDLAANRLRLFHPVDCKGNQVVYWTNEWNEVKLDTDPSGNRWLLGSVNLNGHEIASMFDSGAGLSTVMTRVTQRPGLGPENVAEAMGDLYGVGTAKVPVKRARFKSLTIGQETVQNPYLDVADLFAADREVHLGSMFAKTSFEEPDIVVGSDFFRAHRIYVANSQHKLYFTYQGGPLFAPGAAPQKSATEEPKQ
jgi:predicted aspartyl protease